MIILLSVLLIISFYTFFNKKSTPFFLLSMIIAMSFNLSGFFLSKSLSFLGLLWVLVYLGGMMVIFIYICFLFKEKENKIQCQNYFFFKKKNNFLESIPILTMMLIFIFLFFKLMSKKPEMSHNSSLNLLDWEVYNSITMTSLGFIMLLIIIILISLINILSLLKKSFFFYQKNNIL